MLICLLINIGMPIFDSPKSVHVELTDKCNAECPVCVRRLGGGKLNSIIQNVELGVDYFENLLGEEFCSNVQHWQFCGTKGDPVACSELYEIIVYLKNCNPDCIFSIHTNGGFRSEKWWTKLGRLLRGTPSFVVWGIDGLEDTNHIHRRNVKWNKLWANLNAFNNTGAHSLWQFLVFEHNRHQMSEIKDICKKLNIRFESKDAFGFGIQEKDGIKEVYPIEVFDKDGNFDYTINPHFSNQENVKILPIDPVRRKFTTGIIREYPEYMNMKKGQYDIDCKIGENTSDLYIDCDGALLPCCFIGAGIYTSPLDRQLQSQFKNREEFIPTENYTYKDIFNNSYFTNTIHQGISGDLSEQPKYTIKCLETCGKCL
jgi:hypothetical protein